MKRNLNYPLELEKNTTEVICSSGSERRWFSLIGKAEGLHRFSRRLSLWAEENEMLAGAGKPSVTASTAAAVRCRGRRTDEDWSFVNSQIGFQVVPLITMWFYWWETTGCFPTNYLTGTPSWLWISWVSASSPRAWTARRIKRGKMLQPRQISHAASCPDAPLKQCEV